MVELFIIIGYLGAILCTLTSIYHAIRWLLGKDLFKSRIDINLYYIALFLLLVYVIFIKNLPLIIFIAGILLSTILGLIKPKKKKSK